MMAVIYELPDFVEFLLECNANINLFDKKDHTVFYYILLEYIHQFKNDFPNKEKSFKIKNILIELLKISDKAIVNDLNDSILIYIIYYK